MTETRQKDFASLLVAVFVFLTVMGVGGGVWLLLGVLMGVLGPCSTAPAWFEGLYFPLGLLILVAAAGVASYAAERA